MKSKDSRNRKSKVPKEHKKPWQEAYATVGEIEAMQIVSGQISAKITKEQMGHAFIDLGFERRTFRNVRGYIVVRRSIAETESLRRELATPDTHTPDTPVF